MSQKICKVILLGEANVGKTCLITRYTQNSFSATHEATVGASFSTRELKLDDGTTYLLNVWDTAGAEMFRSINKLFYRDAVICLLVYDITKKDTFDEIKDYWMEEVTKETDDIGNFYLL